MTAYKLGDGLFTESVARPDLEDPEAAKDAARMLSESLQEQVFPLPDETVVAPAQFSDRDAERGRHLHRGTGRSGRTDGRPQDGRRGIRGVHGRGYAATAGELVF